MPIHPITRPATGAGSAARTAGVDHAPAPVRWWEGCRFIALTSIGLWAGIYQAVAYFF